MIKKYNQYIKESLLNKLHGPSEKEIFSIYGDKYDFNTIDEFISYLFNKVELEHINGFSGYFNGVVNGNVIFELNINRYILAVSSKIFNICLRKFENKSPFNDEYNTEMMIKESIKNTHRYSVYNIMFLSRNEHIFESLLDKITGPTEEDLIKKLDTMDLNKAVRRSVEYGLNDVAKKLAYKFKAKLFKDENYYIDAPIYTDSKDFIEALCIASIQNNLDMVKFYIEYIGVNFHYEDEIAMRHAIANGNIEIVKYLLSKGADPSVNNNRPLRIAKENGKVEIYNLMLGYINNNESLLNKIEGPTLDQIKHDLYMNVEKGMLSIEYFLKQCEIHNIERPSNDFIGKIIENEFNTNKTNFIEYILKCKKFNIKTKYNNEEIEKFLINDDFKLFNRIKGLLDNRVKNGKYLYIIKEPSGYIDGFYMNDNEIIVEYDFWDLISSEFIKYTSVKLIEYITVMINLYVDDKKDVTITTENPQHYDSNDYY